MKKYGLQLRIPAQQKPSASRAPLQPPRMAFGDDDEEDVERDISRQASKNKALLKVEEQHKKALEEDPSAFDYDGVYEEMKEKIARPKIQDKTERKSKYIEVLLEKAKQREWEHEIVYERKLLKERSKEDHLYADKDKFVTSAYKKKLAEQQKWIEEERLRAIREEQDDVTKKSDLSDFYFGLNKNVAFGAKLDGNKKPAEQEQATDGAKLDGYKKPAEQEQAKDGPKEPQDHPSDKDSKHFSSDRKQDDHQAEASYQNESNLQQPSVITGSDASSKKEPGKEKTEAEQVSATNTSNERFKRSHDALAAAKERFLARKKAKELL